MKDAMPDDFSGALIARDRDLFLRELVQELAKSLEETVGLEKAEGFISIVGNRIGDLMNHEYQTISGLNPMGVEKVASALVDLKRRIEGGFSIDSMDSEKIVFTNTRCPFGDQLKGRTSLCMMTSNVFGRIAAANLGYARVELQETIASGAAGCRVIVHLQEGGPGREYYH